jgi:hypothetical protein
MWRLYKTTNTSESCAINQMKPSSRRKSARTPLALPSGFRYFPPAMAKVYYVVNSTFLGCSVLVNNALTNEVRIEESWLVINLGCSVSACFGSDGAGAAGSRSMLPLAAPSLWRLAMYVRIRCVVMCTALLLKISSGHEVVQAIKDLGVDPEKNSAAVSLKICRATC